MLTPAAVYKLLNQLNNVTTKDHFGGDGFYANSRMFATVWKDKLEVNLRLSRSEQQKYLSLDGEGFVEIHNAFGKQGWTKVQLEFVEAQDFESAVASAWEQSKIPTSKSKRVKVRKKKKK